MIENEDKILKELSEIKQLTLIGTKKVLTLSETALLTGMSRSHLYKLVCQRRIPYYKSEGGKLTYFHKEEIENWLLASRTMTEDERQRIVDSYCSPVRKPSVQSRRKAAQL